MWLLSTTAMLSVVAYDPKKDPRVKEAVAKGQKVTPHVVSNKTHVLVRARVKADLEQLRPVVPTVQIFEDKVADYRYRAVISRKAFKAYLTSEVDRIDYDSHFKEAARDGFELTQGKSEGSVRYSALMQIWSILARLQPGGAYSGYTSTYSYGAGTLYSGQSKYGAKGKHGKKSYGEALGGSSVVPVNTNPLGDNYPLAGMVDPADWDDAIISYEDAQKKLGAYRPGQLLLSLVDLYSHLLDSEWQLSFGGLHDIEAFDDQAFEVVQILTERHGLGTSISEDTFLAVIDECGFTAEFNLQVENFAQELEDETAPADIHSVPLSADEVQ